MEMAVQAVISPVAIVFTAENAEHAEEKNEKGIRRGGDRGELGKVQG